MRGKAGVNGVVVVTAGITPAHAGKSLSDSYQRVLDQDHPGACEEKRIRMV